MSNTELLSSEAANGTPSTSQQEPEKSTAGAAEANGTPRRRGGLSGMVLAELRQLAGELGIDPTGLRKGDLIAAIKEKQGGSTSTRSRSAKKTQASADKAASAQQPALDEADSETKDSAAKSDGTSAESNNNGTASARSRSSRRQQASDSSGEEDNRRSSRRRRSSRGGSGQQGGSSAQQSADSSGQDEQQQQQQQQRSQRAEESSNGEEEGGRRRGRRFRDRRRNRGRGDGGEPEVREDDVLLPVAGILDVLENYAFVRTSGYLAGPNDVYVSLSLVRKYGLRRGDAIKGMIRQPREGEQPRQKFNPLVRVDSINGLDPETAKNRPEFHKLTPLYPNERLRLETEPNQLTGRIIDLVMPVGKGQRALIVSPPKAGKTMVLQAIANAITTNNPECHLMVVLADERPEEVTDMQRSVKGEVIASTFDRPPSDHTTVAELSIERAKRLVEMGHDVVVLLDSITRLGRAYNLAAPASGRILSGGVDSTALYPPKRFLGAARNIENGGSLTIFATALVETGSTMDTVIFEEFKGTGNAELKLDRKLADKRLFPAVDVDASSTRREEILLSPDELAVTHKLRRVLAALDSQQALELLQDRLRKTSTNIEFLMQVAKGAPGKDED
ncbi:transcription termination factor Rho [Saccharopolyspora rectivirgula]|uniref:Transcription termination factor Rho n=2 Tax=Saccharopolyspora rectivirgula TaxID=28042 RepID=A0A073AUX4_9PSEU|nr:transcription termination factor Rho [Saccharopolyspora rectivirgula]KEI43121.1 transcription termination factor Rho [Saccharopolyspora rectivirgula]